MSDGYYPYNETPDNDEPPKGEDAALSYMKKNAPEKRGPWRAVFYIALTILIVSLIALGAIIFSYLQGQQKYGQLEEYLQTDDPSGEVDPDTPPGTLKVDWESLLAINPDTVAWVYVPGSNINYPVVRGKDNDYYLTHDFDGSQGWLANFGAIFMDYRNAPNWLDSAYFIYGHHMNDGSMFADVANMSNQSKFDECRTVYLLSPNGNFRLRSFSLVRCEATDPLVQISFSSPEEMTEYVQDKMSRSVVRVSDSKPANEITKLFAFATCDNVSSGRFVLYTYVDSTTVDGLLGDVGVATDEGAPVGLVNDIGVE